MTRSSATAADFLWLANNYAVPLALANSYAASSHLLRIP
jgi:hypothetical protein